MYVDALPKAKELVGKVARTAAKLRRSDVIVCPPHAFLGALAPSITRGSVYLGAQDLSVEVEAARTGETSVYMLKSLGVTHVIVGHSERRTMGETNVIVAKKVALALKAGLTPIVCIGERERDMQGTYLSFIEAQIRESLAGVQKAKASRVILAYEPLWAIGKSAADAVTPHVLHEAALFIRKILVSMYGRSAGTAMKILYGGSVESANAKSLIDGGTVDGVLVGHASVDAAEFSDIIRSIDTR
jgi:triosephosphate isomerase